MPRFKKFHVEHIIFATCGHIMISMSILNPWRTTFTLLRQCVSKAIGGNQLWICAEVFICRKMTHDTLLEL